MNTSSWIREKSWSTLLQSGWVFHTKSRFFHMQGTYLFSVRSFYRSICIRRLPDLLDLYHFVWNQVLPSEIKGQMGTTLINSFWVKAFLGGTRWLREGPESITAVGYPWDNDQQQPGWLQGRFILQALLHFLTELTWPELVRPPSSLCLFFLFFLSSSPLFPFSAKHFKTVLFKPNVHGWGNAMNNLKNHVIYYTIGWVGISPLQH